MDYNSMSSKQKKEQWIKKNGLNFLYSIIIALFIVFICYCSDSNFFFYDDAHSEFIPFLKSVGRIWLNGEIPFIVKNTFIGQNQMIDIHRAIFLPQNILFSILSLKIYSLNLFSMIVALINILMLAFFALKIGEALSLNKAFRLTIAFLFSINPIFIYFYLPSWWPGAASLIWFTASLASIFLLRKQFCVKYLIFNILSVVFLLCAGWTHSIIVYIFVFLCTLVEWLNKKELKKIIILLIISFGIFLIGINFYSEYIISSKFLNREIAYGNFGNFFSPSLNYVVMTFNPVYNHFFHRFGGYLITYIPLGYSSIYILFLFCFNKEFFKIFKDKNIKFLFGLIIITFILSQAPTRLGPLQFSFRFLPYFSQLIILFSVYGLSISKLEFSKNRINVFIFIIMLSSMLSFFSVENDFGIVLRANIFFVLLTLSYLYIIIKEDGISILPSMAYSIFMLLLMLSLQKSINGVLPFLKANNSISMENNFSDGGYTLSFTNGSHIDLENFKLNENIEDLDSGQFLLYGLKSINGYSPTGNKEFSTELVNTIFAQHIFSDENIITTIDKLSNRYDNICYFELLNIDSIISFKDKLSNEAVLKLQNCGFIEKEVKNKKIIYFVKNKKNLGNISYVSKGITINKVLEDKSNIEKYSISSKEKGIVILSKIWWRGYTAYVNGEKLNISKEKGLIKIDNIPGGLNNATLEIKYFPRSWRITLWMGLVGVIIILSMLFYTKKLKCILDNNIIDN